MLGRVSGVNIPPLACSCIFLDRRSNLAGESAGDFRNDVESNHAEDEHQRQDEHHHRVYLQTGRLISIQSQHSAA
jgi:hypothetical protein